MMVKKLRLYKLVISLVITEGSERKRDEDALVHLQIASLPYRIEHLSSRSSSSASGINYNTFVCTKTVRTCK